MRTAYERWISGAFDTPDMLVQPRQKRVPQVYHAPACGKSAAGSRMTNDRSKVTCPDCLARPAGRAD